ncbi:restriction endonuclease subunit S [Acinetobacter sp. YH1901136]|uniref:restriction endonuclease subunit S n=1 Tax=Acinetobacter sp. YH1901136 TaxID=2601200 RepID=UPI0015D305E2|nr:restriction endonuclease subunit S [Acinetobacter sp. YH1901136]
MSLENLPVEWSVSQLTKMIASEGLISDGDWIESKDQDEKGDIRLIQLADIGDGDFRDKSNRYMNQDAFDRLNCVELKANDVLIARMPDPLGRACIFPKLPYKCVTVVDVCLIRTGEHSAISPKLLKYWINSTQIRNLIAINATGTTRKRITRKKLESFDFPVPPLAEQQEIVRQLDAMLAQVEQIKTRLDAIPTILKKFRQSVLADAVSGKLTEEWRENNAHILDVEKDYSDLIIAEKNIINKKKNDLKKIKEEKFKLRNNLVDFEKYSFSYPLGWKIFPFFELALLNRGFDLPNSVRTEGEYPILSAGGLIGFHNEYKVKGVCVTVGRSGSVGKVFISEKNSWPLNTTLYVKDFGFSNPKYVYWALMSMDLAKYSSSTAVPSLNRNEFMLEPVAIPPLNEQLEIVKRLELNLEYANQSESLIRSAQKRVNLLTQSILAKAFSGELTAEWRTQHQDLITGVNSAESLLAKIQAEREASKPAKKTRKKKEV